MYLILSIFAKTLFPATGTGYQLKDHFDMFQCMAKIQLYYQSHLFKEDFGPCKNRISCQLDSPRFFKVQSETFLFRPAIFSSKQSECSEFREQNQCCNQDFKSITDIDVKL